MKHILLGAALVALLGLGSADAQQHPAGGLAPIACASPAVTIVTTGGTAVTVLQGATSGFLIVNPLSNTDQAVTAEPLYIDPVGTANAGGFGTTVAIPAGSSYNGWAASNAKISVNATTSGHRFTCLRW